MACLTATQSTCTVWLFSWWASPHVESQRHHSGGKSSFLDAAYRHRNWHSGLFMPGYAIQMYKERHSCESSPSVGFKNFFFTRWSLRSLSSLVYYDSFAPTMTKSKSQRKSLLQKKTAFRETSPFYNGFDIYVQVFWEFSF